MANREFKDWVAGSVKSWDKIDQDGRVLLESMWRDGLDYEKYNLLPQQVLFSIYYVFYTGFNAKKAAEMAGYEASYANIAGNWIRGKNAKPEIQDFLADLMSRTGAQPQDVTGFLTFVMQNDFWGQALDFIEITDKDGNVDYEVKLNLKKVKDFGLTPLIKNVKWHQNGMIQSIELHDAMKAAELLGQAHAMFKKSVEINNITDAAKDAGLSEEDVESIKERIKHEALELKRAERLSQNGVN